MVLQRIEAAIARLEAAAQNAGSKPAAPSALDSAPEQAELEASNARLRAAIGMSLRQIDGLIARHDAGWQR